MKELLETADAIRGIIQSVPGSMWTGSIIFLWVLTEFVRRRTKVVVSGDNSKTLFNEILALLVDPSNWSRDKFQITNGRVSVALPTRAKGQVLTLETSSKFTPNVSITNQAGQKEYLSFSPRQLKKIKRRAVAVYHRLMERESQAMAGRYLSTLRGESTFTAAHDTQVPNPVPEPFRRP